MVPFLLKIRFSSLTLPRTFKYDLFGSAGSSHQTWSTEAETSEPTVGPKSESLTGGEPPESESTDELHALFRPPPHPQGARWEDTCDVRWAKTREAACSKTSRGDITKWDRRAKRGGSEIFLTQNPGTSSALVPATLHLLHFCLKWDDLLKKREEPTYGRTLPLSPPTAVGSDELEQ